MRPTTESRNTTKYLVVTEYEPEELSILSDLLSLVDIRISAQDLGRYSTKELKAAEKWASKTYLRASDNNVKIPEKPKFLNIKRNKK